MSTVECRVPEVRCTESFPHGPEGQVLCAFGCFIQPFRAARLVQAVVWVASLTVPPYHFFTCPFDEALAQHNDTELYAVDLGNKMDLVRLILLLDGAVPIVEPTYSNFVVAISITCVLCSVQISSFVGCR